MSLHSLKYFILSAIVFVASLLSATLLGGCNDAPDYPNNPFGNFDALVDIIDSRYCFFEEKGINWQEVVKEYRSQISYETNDLELFMICSEMLDELRDGHVNLTSRFSTSYYRAWWSDYPQDFDLRCLEQYYLKFNWLSTSGMMYGVLPGNIGYIYYPSFSSSISATSLDYVLALLSETNGLILDIRDNGGGLLTNIDTLIGRFIDHEIPGGSICHKTGPGHSDFSKPYPFTYSPAPAGRITYLNKPICLLINRSCYSAANAFAAVMKSLPNVALIGARTGGGSGLPFSSELPNGWNVRFSASPLYGPNGKLTEFGIAPTEGYEIHAPAEDLAKGQDAILNAAISLLTPTE